MANCCALFHLIRTLDKNGETGAAALLADLGSKGEGARDLAYRWYNILDARSDRLQQAGYLLDRNYAPRRQFALSVLAAIR